MHLSPATARLLVATAFPIEEISLRPGAEVVARVAWVRPGGAGLLALAGAHVHAKLPPGLVEGQKLPLTVVGTNSAGELVFRLRPEWREPDGGDERGTQVVRPDDPPVAVPLPGGAVAELRIEDDDGSDTNANRRGQEASIVLHSPVLGPIEIELRLDASGTRARVVVEAGEAVERARAGLDELTEALLAATARPTLASVAARPPDAPRPRPAQEAFDAYA